MRDTPRTISPTLLAALMFTALAVLATAPAAAQTPAATLEAAEGATLWQLNDDGGLAVFGAFDYDSGTIPIEGPGTRLMWYPGKAAFRAGRVSGSQWDDENVGVESTALSFNSTASGNYSTAIGAGTEASGTYSTAMGVYTTAIANRSTAMGDGTEASGNTSTAMGTNTEASGNFSTAMGKGTIAATGSSTSIGTLNDANQTDDGTLFVVGNGNIKHGRSDALRLDDAGNLTIAGSLTQDSDRRLKTDIASLKGNALDALAEIRPVRYRFREGTGHPTDRQIGLIAQEVQHHFPELVSENEEGYLSLSYSKLTAVLVKGLQEQQAQIEALQARAERVDALEARLAALEAEQADRQHAGWAWPAGALVLGLIFVGGLTWHRRA